MIKKKVKGFYLVLNGIHSHGYTQCISGAKAVSHYESLPQQDCYFIDGKLGEYVYFVKHIPSPKIKGGWDIIVTNFEQDWCMAFTHDSYNGLFFQ